MDLFKLVSAYCLIAIFFLSSVILLAIIVHLCSKLPQKRKNKKKKVQFFLLITIVAVIFFELGLLLVIAIVVQIILIDAHKLHVTADWIDHVFYDAFEYMAYLIAIFDTAGHLCVIIVFIARFQIIFQTGASFGGQKRLMFVLYSCVAVLSFVAVIIIILICIEHTVLEIMIIEIVWEILVDFMCLWVLYLFISRLYLLLRLSFRANMNSNKTDLLKQIIEATKASLAESKSEKSRSRSGDKPKYHYTLTLDGMKIDPLSATQKSSKPGNSPEPATELTVTTMHNGVGDAHSDNEQFENERTEVTVHTLHDLNEETCVSAAGKTGSGGSGRGDTNGSGSNSKPKAESNTIDLIGVMTKTTLLVTLTVFVSVLGVIGNIFIEFEEMQNIEKHDISITELWAEILPVIDVLVTSLMLYLQFNFTHNTYRFLLRKLDIWFVTNCLKMVECVWKREMSKDERNASFLVTNSTKTATLETATDKTEEIL